MGVEGKFSVYIKVSIVLFSIKILITFFTELGKKPLKIQTGTEKTAKVILGKRILALQYLTSNSTTEP